MVVYNIYIILHCQSTVTKALNNFDQTSIPRTRLPKTWLVYTTLLIRLSKYSRKCDCGLTPLTFTFTWSIIATVGCIQSKPSCTVRCADKNTANTADTIYTCVNSPYRVLYEGRLGNKQCLSMLCGNIGSFISHN